MSELAPEQKGTGIAFPPPNSRGWWIDAAVLAGVCLLVRAVGLMTLPIFGDEAIYLRWAELVRQGHPWVSLIDPKPPLHFWLLAAVTRWTADPLAAGRMLSVMAGVLSIPALMAACGEIARLAKPGGVSGRVLGLVAGVLMIFSPFAGFYQRLATADALFVLEMLLVVWIALRWARGGGWGWAIALGIAMGTALMTRQGLSYTLCGGVAMAGIVQWRLVRGKIGIRILQATTAAVIALALWSPFLMAEMPRYLADAKAENPQATQWNVIKRRILNQEQFTQGAESKFTVALRNGAKTFLPMWFEPGKNGVERDMGWLWGYMTWPVYVLSVIGLVFLAVRGQWAIFGFVMVWAAMMLGPPVVLGNVIYSRYMLAGAVVLLVPAAWMLAELLAVIAGWKNFGWAIAAILLIGVLALGMREVGRQATRWWEQNLTRGDRYQYVTGWPAGMAVNQAIGYLRQQAAGGPIVVITDDGWGLPADAVWDYLEGGGGAGNVRVCYTSVSGTSAILLPASGEPNSYLLRKEKYLYTPTEEVRIDPAERVFFVTGLPADAESKEKRLRELNPTMGRELIFSGIDQTQDKVGVFSVK